MEVNVGLERIGIFEYSPAVPADVTLLTCGNKKVSEQMDKQQKKKNAREKSLNN